MSARAIIIGLFVSAILWAIIFGFVMMARADPFLVCDAPDPAEQVTHYNIWQDGILIGDKVSAQLDGSLKMDLEGIMPGVYSFTTTAINVWGESDTADPYVSPTGATAPVGVGLVAQ